jgi:hypothetical protein
MSALREFKVLVRKKSTKTMDYLISKYKRVMNEFQEKKENKKDCHYKFIWYAHIFDTRTLKEYMVFCDYATKLFEIDDSYITKDGKIIKGVMYLSEIVDKVNELEKRKTPIFRSEPVFSNSNIKGVRAKFLG